MYLLRRDVLLLLHSDRMICKACPYESPLETCPVKVHGWDMTPHFCELYHDPRKKYRERWERQGGPGKVPEGLSREGVSPEIQAERLATCRECEDRDEDMDACMLVLSCGGAAGKSVRRHVKQGPCLGEKWKR